MDEFTLESRLKPWQEKYAGEGFKKWQVGGKNPDLWNFIDRLCPEGNAMPGIFFVPLCGKSLDLKYLYDEGYKVFGVEFCEPAVQEFFSANNLPHEVTNPSAEYKLYSTPDRRLRVACGDFLTFTKDLIGDEEVKVVWDRGAFGVIEKENRKRYAEVMRKITEGLDVKYLLRVWDYEDLYKSTPPLSCPLKMIDQVFGPDYDIEEVQRIESERAAAGFGSPFAVQIVYLMTTKKV